MENLLRRPNCGGRRSDWLQPRVPACAVAPMLSLKPDEQEVPVISCKELRAL